MPATTAEEKLKENQMQKCLKDACRAPLETMELVYEGIKLHEESDISSLTIISDIGVGVQMLKAALNSAYLSVLINLKYINDDQYVNNLKEQKFF